MQNVRRFKVVKGEEARQEILAGAYFAADAVRRTLGPFGRNWISGIRGGTPHITNDGVSILRLLTISDNEIQYLGLRALREAALKLNDLCGDGTTTAAVLTYNILLAATKRLGYTVLDPAKNVYQKGTLIDAPSVMALKRQIQQEATDAIVALENMAQPVASKDELIGAVRVAVEDQDLAQMIGSMQWELGPDGTILVEDTNEPKDSVEKVPGIRIDNGFPVSKYINNEEKQRLELEDVHVIFTNAEVGSLQDFRSEHQEAGAGVIDVLFQNLVKNGKRRRLVIVARRFNQLAVHEIAENFKRGAEIYPLNAPYVNQTQIFKDIAALLGGTFMDVEENHSLRDMTLSDVGFAKRVQATRWSATLSGEDNEKAAARIKVRLELMQKEWKGEQSPFARNMLDARMAQLKNGIGIMKVGALSEAEQKRKRDKVDDAVASARAALQEGLVPGAGQALKAAGETLAEDAILREALASIYKQIQANAGQDFPIEEWVRDPLKVVRTAVAQAADIAGSLLTVEGAIDHENPPKWQGPRPLESFAPEELGPDGTNPV